MRNKLIGIAIAALLAVGVVGSVAANATPPNPEHKVDVCHRTGSSTNPYVFINVDIASSGYVKGGHDNHEQVGNGLGGDIIAAYEYTRKDGSVFVYPGKNLTTIIGGSTGAAILANGCNIPGETPPPPPPVEFSPSLDASAVCAKDGTVTVTFTGDADGGSSDVALPFVVKDAKGTVELTVTFSKEGAEDVTLTASVEITGDCGSTDEPPTDEPPTVNPPKAPTPTVVTRTDLAETL